MEVSTTLDNPTEPLITIKPDEPISTKPGNEELKRLMNSAETETNGDGETESTGDKTEPNEDQVVQPPEVPTDQGPKEDPEFLFQENEKILCFHDHVLYEGKIVQTKLQDNEANYLVHYIGWNKKWNEWMNDVRILKYTDENLERKRDLELSQNPSATKSSKNGKQQKLEESIDGKTRSSTPLLELDAKGNKIPGTSEGKELKIAAKNVNVAKNVESEMFFNKKQEIFISIPNELKMYLAEDWERINFKNQLVTLPSKYNLNQILEAYLETKDENDMDAAELMESIAEIFDQMLSDQFLYPSERIQLSEVLKNEDNKDKYFSDLYGGHHLLRLISKLGQFLAFSVLEKHQVDELNNQLKDFFCFLTMKDEEYFGAEHYHTPSAEYIKKASKLN